MLVDILSYIKCIICAGKLELECIKGDEDCIEGFLHCDCNAIYPIIDGVAIIVDDISKYFSSRSRVLGDIFVNSSESMKKYLRYHAKNIKKTSMDVYEEYSNLFKIYECKIEDNIKYLLSINTDFYEKIVDTINVFTINNYLDIGCGTGYIVNNVSSNLAIGIDKSFSMIRRARKYKKKNREFIVADLFALPFKEFDLVSCINVIDLFDVDVVIQSIKKSIKKDGYLILVDPYDFRDAKGYPLPLYDERGIREILKIHGFKIENDKEEYIPWLLKINKRSYILYFCDLIIAKLIK
ncbi:MAG: class I SAM-dependent methyltransferase [Candidatus Nitrosocaldaceae archaeon]